MGAECTCGGYENGAHDGYCDLTDWDGPEMVALREQMAAEKRAWHGDGCTGFTKDGKPCEGGGPRCDSAWEKVIAEEMRARLARITGEVVAAEMPALMREFGRDPGLLSSDFAARVAASYAPQFKLNSWSAQARAEFAAASDEKIRDRARRVLAPQLRATIMALLKVGAS